MPDGKLTTETQVQIVQEQFRREGGLSSSLMGEQEAVLREMQQIAEGGNNGDLKQYLEHNLPTPLDVSAMRARESIVGKLQPDGSRDASSLQGSNGEKSVGEQIQETHAILQEFLNKGYDKIGETDTDQDDKDRKKALVRGWVEEQLTQHGVTASILEGLSDDQKQQYIEGLCRNPRVLHHIREQVRRQIAEGGTKKQEIDQQLQTAIVNNEDLSKLYEQSDQMDRAYLSGLEQAVKQGVGEWVQEQVDDSVSLLQKALKDQAQKAKERKEKAQQRAQEKKRKADEQAREEQQRKKAEFQEEFYRKLQGRYAFQEKNMFGKIRWNYHRESIHGDYDILLGSGDEQLLISVLQREGLIPANTNQQGGAGALEQLKTIGFSDEEIKTMKTEVASQLVHMKIASGGIRPTEVHIIANTPWGKGVIEKALEKNKAAKQMIDELAKEGGILQRGWNRVKEILKKNPWMLYVLLGIGAIAVAGIKAGIEEMSYAR